MPTEDTNDKLFTIPAKWSPHAHHHFTKPNLMIATLKEVVSFNDEKSESYDMKHMEKKGLHI